MVRVVVYYPFVITVSGNFSASTEREHNHEELFVFHVYIIQCYNMILILDLNFRSVC